MPSPTVMSWASLVKPSPQWFLPFPLSGNHEAISSQMGPKQNTHRALATGQLFVLTELATSGCRGGHFPGEGHQLRGGQLGGLLCVCNEKPGRSVFHQILSHLWGFGLLAPSQRPSFGMRGHEVSSLFYPHGTGAAIWEVLTLTPAPCTSILPTYHNGKQAPDGRRTSIPNLKASLILILIYSVLQW